MNVPVARVTIMVYVKIWWLATTAPVIQATLEPTVKRVNLILNVPQVL